MSLSSIDMDTEESGVLPVVVVRSCPRRWSLLVDAADTTPAPLVLTLVPAFFELDDLFPALLDLL